ncbi:hypothetical protein EDC19_0324 [Natranaerovirga hydrolytica]|uniref:Helix-turn-helix resolvase-like protein n=1 Tax=Natranaerovirga hydrolytica TaxID=680378 RepID=A0A4R1MZD7_9FIRM|nr:DUF6115 domain-containing protein [Natranaerovirga hydrolytica]TCK97922.1 hypothetical protein EDC19_0324 [Natranaerovirga hydrolytica]
MNFSFSLIHIIVFTTGIIILMASFFLGSHKKENETNHHEPFDEPIQEDDSMDTKKIMAINEYSDYVLEEIEKKHKELLFMYQIINEKEKNLKHSISQIHEKDGYKVSDGKKNPDNEIEKVDQDKIHDHTENQRVNEELISKDYDAEDVDKVIIDESFTNYNKEVLDLYRTGQSIKQIAKDLDIGIGEVRLIIDLFKEVT